MVEEKSHGENGTLFEEDWEKEGKELIRMLKLTPLLALYAGQVAHVYQSVGMAASGLASLWFVFVIIGWPKSIIVQALLAIVLGVVVPFFVL
ncbi:hypothetical protein A11A3_07915 [Alcanivorax hongdengensis A-11-3]|uniref:Uncharacterized protein n=1 Tax=Alcanivorax hongdengensis A-11-3 TaxID=1177179 RepID=L0WC64_9GAMM|nr:hypothetical protein [Alcanivorax hongdengensis]EKF74536.1 hypothetical protein A11A3_07915 [Alcanivorax hongdengensis A-11-3]